MTDDRQTASEALYARNRIRYGNIIRTFRIRRGLSQPELAQRVGVQKNAVSNWEAGRSRPDLDTVPLLCKALGIDIPRFFGAVPRALSADDRNLLERYHRLSDENRQVLYRMAQVLLEAQPEKSAPIADIRARRLFYNEARTAAGVGNPLDSRRRGRYVYLRDDGTLPEADEIVTVTGDSMEPTFHDGDDLLVRYSDGIRPGEIGIFVADGEGYVKEYQPDGLHSHNPAYAVLKFGDDDNVRCVGRVTGRVAPEQYLTEEETAAFLEIHETESR